MQTPNPSEIRKIIHDAMSRHAYSWMPGLAQLLARRLWQSRNFEFQPSNYGSLRWSLSDPKGNLATVATIDVNGYVPPIVIETLPPHAQRQYEELGLQILEKPPSVEDLALFHNAFSLLSRAFGLSESVAALVRSIHILVTSKTGYDTSHSNPDLPCSIFLSIPTGEQHAQHRLAESIVHEAMHLQLTMLEKDIPLVRDEGATGYSPWQHSIRPIGGVLHGLFVFRVIDQWLGEMTTDKARLGKDDRRYISKRRAEIASEIELVSELGTSFALTDFGRKFASWLLEMKMPIKCSPD